MNNPVAYAAAAALIACLVTQSKTQEAYQEDCSGTLLEKITNGCKLTREDKIERRKTCRKLKDAAERAQYKCKAKKNKKQKPASNEEDVMIEEEDEYAYEEDEYAYEDDGEAEYEAGGSFLDTLGIPPTIFGINRLYVIAAAVLLIAVVGFILYRRSQEF